MSTPPGSLKDTRLRQDDWIKAARNVFPDIVTEDVIADLRRGYVALQSEPPTEPVRAWRGDELDTPEYLQHRLVGVNAHLERVDAQLHAIRVQHRRAIDRVAAAERKAEELAALVDELYNLRVSVEREQSQVLHELRLARKSGR